MSESEKVIYLKDFNPEMVLNKARRFVGSDNLVKAINEYLRYLKVRPKDLRARQQLADLYARVDMRDAACKHFSIVAEGYADGGFYLKAIAIYKQMQNLQPDNPECLHRCAELNQRQGLVGNALSDYRRLVDLYRQQGKDNEVLQVYEIVEGLMSGDPTSDFTGLIEDSDFIFDEVNNDEFSFDEDTHVVSEFDFDEPNFDFDESKDKDFEN